MSWVDSCWQLTVQEERELWKAHREAIEQNQAEYLEMFSAPRRQVVTKYMLKDNPLDQQIASLVAEHRINPTGARFRAFYDPHLEQLRLYFWKEDDKEVAMSNELTTYGTLVDCANCGCTFINEDDAEILCSHCRQRAEPDAHGNGSLKASLEFDLDLRKREFLCACAGEDMASIVWELVNNQMRSWIKHGAHECKTPEEAFQTVREWLIIELDDHGIALDALVG